MLALETTFLFITVFITTLLFGLKGLAKLFVYILIGYLMFNLVKPLLQIDASSNYLWLLTILSAVLSAVLLLIFHAVITIIF